MKSYDYFSPRTVDEALEVLKDGDKDTYILAGGTDIIIEMNQGKTIPKTVVNINKIDEMRYIKSEKGFIRIGALTNFTMIERNELLREKVKVLVNACKEVGSTQIRNLGTVGGNIVSGSPAADSVSALVALDATVVVKSKNGERETKLTDFYDNGKPRIGKDEILLEVFFKEPNENTATTFTRLVKRKAVDIVVLSMGALIEKDEKDKCVNAQFSLGAVARNPIRLYEIEKNLIGKEVNKENLDGLLEDMSEFIYSTILEGSPWRLDSAFYKSKSIRGVAGTTFDDILLDLDIQ